MTQPTPYIGVSCVRHRNDIANVDASNLCLFKLPSARRKIMIGTASSLQTIMGEPTGCSNRDATMEEMPHIFTSNSAAFNLIHHAARGEALLTLFEQLEKLVLLAGPNLHGFQLNVVWPDPMVISDLKGLFPHLKFVLGIGPESLKMVGNRPQGLAQRLKDRYRHLIDYILFDMSQGTGKKLDPELARPFLAEVASTLPDLGLGVAGKLSAPNLYLVEPLLGEFPDISVDAETDLRDENDHLDFVKTRAWLMRAQDMFFYSDLNSGRLDEPEPIDESIDIGGSD